ncbi:cold shock domain-containing protein, partial [Phormidium pseudopriestleyi FRX01]
MAIDFGSIKTYNPDRGFGFVGGTFANSYRQVFFHIKTIKRQCSELAEKLESGENFREVNLWYQTETTEKGEQVSLVWLNVDDIPQVLKQELSDLIEKLENIWKDLSSPKPIWLDLVTIELIGANRRNELSIARDNLQSQRRQAQEEQR